MGIKVVNICAKRDYLHQTSELVLHLGIPISQDLFEQFTKLMGKKQYNEVFDVLTKGPHIASMGERELIFLNIAPKVVYDIALESKHSSSGVSVLCTLEKDFSFCESEKFCLINLNINFNFSIDVADQLEQHLLTQNVGQLKTLMKQKLQFIDDSSIMQQLENFWDAKPSGQPSQQYQPSKPRF